MASTQSSSFRAAPIQSVQELIKEPIPAVPQPFILDDPQPPILSASTPLPLLPTIDMKHLIMSETAGSELEKLHAKNGVSFRFLSTSIISNHFFCIALEL